MSKFKNLLFRSIAIVASITVSLALGEVAFRCMYFQQNSETSWAIEEFLRPYNAKLKADKYPVPRQLSGFIHEESQLRELFPIFIKDQIAFANSPLTELRSELTESIYRDEQGVLRNKAGHVYEVAFMRSRLYNEWDPILYKDNRPGEQKSPETEAFKKQYCLSSKISHIGPDGLRITVPASESEDVILVLGDSVAYGAVLNDDETIASQLQSIHPQYRFINAGVGGSPAVDNLNRLQQLFERFGKAIKCVIYVHCENDFNSESSPETIIEGLTKTLESGGSPPCIFVYTHYIERSMPDLCRLDSEAINRKYYALKEQTLTLAREAGFQIVDQWPLIDQWRVNAGTPFAGFSLYVDHCHPSALGVKLLVNAIELPKENPIGSSFPVVE